MASMVLSRLWFPRCNIPLKSKVSSRLWNLPGFFWHSLDQPPVSPGVLNLPSASELFEDLVKMQILINWVWHGLRFSISNILLSDAHGASHGNKVLELKFLPLTCSVAPSCPTLHKPMDCSRPGFPVLHYFLEFAPTHVHWFDDAIQPSHPLLPLLLLPSVFPSIRVFSSESALFIRWPKCWGFSISPSSEYSGLTSFRIDWFDLLAIQGTLKSLLQYHSSKVSILQHLAFLYSLTLKSIHDYWRNHSFD